MIERRWKALIETFALFCVVVLGFALFPLFQLSGVGHVFGAIFVGAVLLAALVLTSNAVKDIFGFDSWF